MGWTIRTLKCYWRLLVALLTPVILLPLPAAGGHLAEIRCAYVILIMIVFWLTEALPLPITALIPVFAYPFLGILTTMEVCLNYFVDPIMLFLSGLLFAVSMDNSGLNKRLAFSILINIGISPSMLMAGFMATTIIISMWINNTAATALVLPTLEAVLDELENEWQPHKPTRISFEIPTITVTDIEANKETSLGELNEGFEDECPSNGGEAKVSQPSANRAEAKDEVNKKDYSMDNLRRSMYLSVAFSASIGGTGFMTGTPSNLVLTGYLTKAYTESTELNFLTWMEFNVPLMLLCALGGWGILQYLYFGFKSNKILAIRERRKKEIMRRIVRTKYQSLGPLSFHEGVITAFFILLFVIWLLRTPRYFPGWDDGLKKLYGRNIDVTDTSIYILVVLLLFVIPANLPDIFNSSTEPVPWKPCLLWKDIQNRIPWGVVLLLGGAYAMADGARASQLLRWLGRHISNLYVAPLPIVIFFGTLISVGLTNIVPNVAAANLLLPIFNEMSLENCSNPLYILIPATICCSYAFILPASATANAIVYFSSDRLQQWDMIKTGIGMNCICIFFVNVMINTLGFSVFNLSTLPSWMNSTTSPMAEPCYNYSYEF